MRILVLLVSLALAVMPALAEEAEDNEDDSVVYDPSEELEFESEMDGYMLEEREKVAEMRSLLLIGIDARPGE